MNRRRASIRCVRPPGRWGEEAGGREPEAYRLHSRIGFVSPKPARPSSSRPSAARAGTHEHWPMIMGPRFRGDDRVEGIGFVSPKWPSRLSWALGSFRQNGPVTIIPNRRVELANGEFAP